MKKNIILLLPFFVMFIGLLIFLDAYTKRLSQSLNIAQFQVASIAATITSPLYYSFSNDGTLEETSNIDTSSSPYWWLSSGAMFIFKNGTGQTIQGKLSYWSKWRLLYAVMNPIDTGGGYYPQNTLRLVTRSKWQNPRQEIYFKINKINLIDSPNRNPSNGVNLFNRYIDQNNLYTTGVRVDGKAVIKKKVNGKYYTMATKQIYPGTYNRDTNPNLLPVGTWVGIRSEVTTNTNGTVKIKMYIDKDRTGNWILVTEAVDDSIKYGGSAIINGGYGGIRTDFMDTEFDDYRMTNI